MAPENEVVNGERYAPLQAEVHRLDSKYSMPIEISRQLPDKLNSHGWVYILSNKFMPGLLKIGMTTTSPQIRCKELSSGTNVPAPFTIEASFFSDDPRGDESSIHAELAEFRVNNSREFFNCSLSEAMEICSTFCLCISSSSLEELANNHDVICLDDGIKLDLHEWFEEFGIAVVGPKSNAAKAIFELGCERLEEMRQDGLSLVIEGGFIHGILTEDTQSQLAYLREMHERAVATGVYGPRQPGGF